MTLLWKPQLRHFCKENGQVIFICIIPIFLHIPMLIKKKREKPKNLRKLKLPTNSVHVKTGEI